MARDAVFRIIAASTQKSCHHLWLYYCGQYMLYPVVFILIPFTQSEMFSDFLFSSSDKLTQLLHGMFSQKL